MSSMAVEPQPLYPVPPSFPCIDAAAWLALGLAKLMPITIGGLAGRTSLLDIVSGAYSDASGRLVALETRATTTRRRLKILVVWAM